MTSLAVALYAACSSPYFLLVEAEVWLWPRPLVAAVDRVSVAVWDAARSDAVYPLWREWDNARHATREFCRDAAALALLLTTSPKGALR
ncbi:hypothetical protein [Streptomyces sp. FL07-04A]|uniref:hypothetical protein n=1 Tax=Streptomyces sp. FL07-04A TaxID=3028658 RepID=UPI0029BC11D8|nr:hypothetical protein [Streptomyces sp. FL07-04A]MDX3575918.1 hypothetical protein [Streptomyces sp. FL07-04A]